ncbi:hypothetical protein N7456_001000 [Penicillium angulare]|uniref:Uncharacterized protein n=1 Tax=Penicillium angulare TaxID=116970 RepID=A0A9W9GD92_9EURO|nr:hypothetical protein N7456_001000 [Penicillium angulare]
MVSQLKSQVITISRRHIGCVGSLKRKSITAQVLLSSGVQDLNFSLGEQLKSSDPLPSETDLFQLEGIDSRFQVGAVAVGAAVVGADNTTAVCKLISELQEIGVNRVKLGVEKFDKI